MVRITNTSSSQQRVTHISEIVLVIIPGPIFTLVLFYKCPITVKGQPGGATLSELKRKLHGVFNVSGLHEVLTMRSVKHRANA